MMFTLSQSGLAASRANMLLSSSTNGAWACLWRSKEAVKLLVGTTYKYSHVIGSWNEVLRLEMFLRKLIQRKCHALPSIYTREVCVWAGSRHIRDAHMMQGMSGLRVEKEVLTFQADGGHTVWSMHSLTAGEKVGGCDGPASQQASQLANHFSSQRRHFNRAFLGHMWNSSCPDFMLEKLLSLVWGGRGDM